LRPHDTRVFEPVLGRGGDLQERVLAVELGAERGVFLHGERVGGVDTGKVAPRLN